MGLYNVGDVGVTANVMPYIKAVPYATFDEGRYLIKVYRNGSDDYDMTVVEAVYNGREVGYCYAFNRCNISAEECLELIYKFSEGLIPSIMKRGL